MQHISLEKIKWCFKSARANWNLLWGDFKLPYNHNDIHICCINSKFAQQSNMCKEKWHMHHTHTSPPYKKLDSREKALHFFLKLIHMYWYSVSIFSTKHLAAVFGGMWPYNTLRYCTIHVIMVMRSHWTFCIKKYYYINEVILFSCCSPDTGKENKF